MPQFRVLANSQDITAKIRERLKHLKLTDERGVTSDTLEICLADHDTNSSVPVPSTGAKLEVFLGYDGSVRRMGLFVVDEIELSGFPREMTIRARAAPYETSKQGRLDLQTQKTRSWKAGTTLGQLVRRIAGEHRLTPSISASLAGIALPHTDQANESDMNLLHRLAKRYDAAAKPAGGHLLFLRRGDAHSVTGAVLARVTLTPSDGSDYAVTIASPAIAPELSWPTIAISRKPSATLSLWETVSLCDGCGSRIRIKRPLNLPPRQNCEDVRVRSGRCLTPFPVVPN